MTAVARGKHTKGGYPWGITDKEFASISVPRVIVSEVKECAQNLWEKRKKESEQLLQGEETED